ncbi:MAG: DUF3568 family protein [Acidithiobacillus sp.]|nr:DUF3568 family protein [Acidithiobacillus sp.]
MRKPLLFATAFIFLILTLAGCSSTLAPKLNPIPYYTYYPASLPIVTNAAERAMAKVGMRVTATKSIDPQTTEIQGFTASGDAVLITLHQLGASVTKFEARIGLVGHLREVQEVEHWMGQYVGQAIATPNS